MRARRAPPRGDRGARRARAAAPAADAAAASRLLFGDPILRVSIGAAVAALLFISASMTVEVFYVRDVVGAGGAGYALVFAAWTAGMVPGAIGVAPRSRRRRWPPRALAALALQGAGMAAAAPLGRARLV